eukprot:CAMPEP_0170138452 /NCGR_PEP_ID=MMETSP0033_2-20121228/4925_1 /TAXON_ID=195969 /ORGANISM="Dolichomastix tenuilepis, Strain CCMP3274" /LENGTH=456 /DNA_ID=CAMNT_0010374461 /DNA_START=80 /DNA_END=1450 /DNA_ORIENTATION=+
MGASQSSDSERAYEECIKLNFRRYGLDSSAEIPPIKVVVAVNNLAFNLLAEMASSRDADGDLIAPAQGLGALYTAVAGATTLVEEGPKRGGSATLQLTPAALQFNDAILLPLAFEAGLEAFARVLTSAAGEPPGKSTFMQANCLWVSKAIHREYAEFAKAMLGLEVKGMTTSAEKINEWGAGRSFQRLTGLVGALNFREVDRGALFGTNVTVFDGVWDVAFDEAQTKLDHFVGKGGIHYSCMMMRRRERRMKYMEVWGGDPESTPERPGIVVENPTNLSVAVTSGMSCQVVEVPFDGGELVADIILPAANVACGEVVASLAREAGRLSRWVAALRFKDVELRLPRFESECNTGDLRKALAEVGVSDAFAGDAPFKRASAEPLWLYGITAKSALAIREDGGKPAPKEEANKDKMITAALSAVATNVHCNRPFIFVIRHRFGYILQACIIQKPTFPGV